MPKHVDESVFSHESWRVFRIMSEFVEAFDTLGSLGAAVSIYGSARLPASETQTAGSTPPVPCRGPK